MQHILSNVQPVRRERNLVRSGTNAYRDAVLLTRRALKIADEKGDQVSGHLRRRQKLERMLSCARAGRVCNDRCIRNARILRVNNKRDIETGLHRWFIKGW